MLTGDLTQKLKGALLGECFKPTSSQFVLIGSLHDTV